ncbi:MAG TPA: hypothetical protein VH482_03970, partial [Thermomicrobiales bacterium]
MKPLNLFWIVLSLLLVVSGQTSLRLHAFAEDAATPEPSASVRDIPPDAAMGAPLFPAAGDAADGETDIQPDIAGTPGPTTRTSGVVEGDVLPDLAAMVLRPDDLGVPGFRERWGKLMTLEEWAAEDGTTVAKARTDGAVPLYFTKLYNPPTSDPNRSRQYVVTELWVYPDGDAADHWIFPIASHSLDAGYDVVPGNRPIATHSFILRGTCTCGRDRPDPVLVIAFRRDNLVARVLIGNSFGDTGSMPDPILDQDAVTIERLATIVSKRMAEVTARGPGEGIGPMALRLGDGRRIYETTGDDYRRLGGRDFPMWYETADDTDLWNRIMVDAVDFYVLNQSFDAGGDTVVYGTYLYRYGSVESAAKRMRRHFSQTEPDPGFTHYEILDLGTF